MKILILVIFLVQGSVLDFICNKIEYNGKVYFHDIVIDSKSFIFSK